MLENDPRFNAGLGAVFNDQGEVELDPSVMDGSTTSDKVKPPLLVKL